MQYTEFQIKNPNYKRNLNFFKKHFEYVVPRYNSFSMEAIFNIKHNGVCFKIWCTSTPIIQETNTPTEIKNFILNYKS